MKSAPMAKRKTKRTRQHAALGDAGPVRRRAHAGVDARRRARERDEEGEAKGVGADVGLGHSPGCLVRGRRRAEWPGAAGLGRSLELRGHLAITLSARKTLGPPSRHQRALDDHLGAVLEQVGRLEAGVDTDGEQACRRPPAWGGVVLDVEAHLLGVRRRVRSSRSPRSRGPRVWRPANCAARRLELVQRLVVGERRPVLEVGRRRTSPAAGRSRSRPRRSAYPLRHGPVPTVSVGAPRSVKRPPGEIPLENSKMYLRPSGPLTHRRRRLLRGDVA